MTILPPVLPRTLTILPRLILTASLLLLLAGCEWEMFSDSDDRDQNDDSSPLQSQVTGAELGVSSLTASLPVFTDGLGMEIVTEIDTSAVRQVVLTSSGSPFTAQLTLTEFRDGVGRPLDNNPGKLVFFTPDASALAMAFANAGGDVTLPPTQQGDFGIVGFGRDPDRNLIEFAQRDDAEGPYFAAFGLGVSNLEEALEFWTGVVGLEERLFLQTQSYDEYILGTDEPQTLPLVIMNWTNGVEQRYQGNETRVRVATEDPQELARRTTPNGEEAPQDPDGNRLIIGQLSAD